MKKASIKILFALFFAVCLTLQLSMGVFAARDAVGDLDGNGLINKDDAIHLLGNTIFSEIYHVDQPCDYNKDGKVDKDDAIYLLGYTIFSDVYYICQHEDSKWAVSEVVLPTCNAEGYTLIVCSCGETDKTDYTPANAEAHVWNVKDDSHSATCLENGYIVMACDVCGMEETIEDLATGHEYEMSCTEDTVCFYCEAVIPATGHKIKGTPIAVVDATCTEDGYVVYECKYCTYTYTEITTPATGHTAPQTEWSAPVMQETADNCVYVWVETASCAECGKALERISDAFVHHVEYVSVTDATCSEPGEKTVTCQLCSVVLSETEIPVNEEAHVWTEVSTEGNVVSYECSLCHGTKKTAATVSGELTSLGDADEILVNNISIAPDASTSEQLSGLDIYVSADIRDVGDMENINDEIAERLSEAEVYSLTIKDENQDEITSFDGMVTVSIPYALADGEDPATIMVWYIDVEGNVTVVEDVEYRDGYIVFRTNHFSDYGVIRMTANEICATYGHNYIDSSVPATCMSGGYVGARCSRCKDEQITEKLESLGHNWELTSETVATCDKAG
ncbi:MAG: dockerin type I repeat-containing protein, partial [Clostridia bacterium]|nr:dockerin type I repeat-containing protein [Clostridia bacterium]